MSDPFSLKRFELAQEQSGTFERAVLELQAGRKRSHWMWFVFPQLRGLGQSPMSQKYAISSRAEARAYLEHPVLGPRLVRCTQIVAELRGRSAEDVFGGTDATKLRSSMTLFARVCEEDSVFHVVLARYFDGYADVNTDVRLASGERGAGDPGTGR
ncbi:MAG TPA: DUF1810 domain-containing protein [Solirubrobacteraceae bacterium]|nr:DUF1810 domain-containing protein [Solirubrobacteraceae bacterium]